MKRATTALLLIDFINPLDFEGGDRLARFALAAARRTAALKARVRAAGFPVIYANDNFGRWQAEFSQLVRDCSRGRSRGSKIVELVRPGPEDLSILKPRHSAFYGTPLEFLLDELGVRRLILSGLAADICVLFTAHDAYLRKFELWVPSDCVASESNTLCRDALTHMRTILKATTASSSAWPGAAMPMLKQGAGRRALRQRSSARG